VIYPKIAEVSGNFRGEQNNKLIITGKEDFIVPEYSSPAIPEIKTIFDAIVKEYDRGEPMSPLLNRTYLIQFLACLMRSHSGSNIHSLRKHHLIFYITQKLQEYAHLPYQRSWLKEWSQYHEDHAARLFREHTGVSPHDYHLEQKMIHAKKLLAHTDLSITEIAEQLRLGSIHYFSRRFKLCTGRTPSDYRKLRKMIYPHFQKYGYSPITNTIKDNESI
jgi:AraC-like DNA-binding protein